MQGARLQSPGNGWAAFTKRKFELLQPTCQIKAMTNFINVDPQLPWLKIHPTCALHAEKYLDYHIDQREDELHQCRSAATMAKDSPYLHFACREIPGLSH